MENGIANSKYNDEELYDSYLSLDASKDAIINQAEVIRKIASEGSAAIVGRSADYILRNNKNLVKVFIYAPLDFRIKNIMQNYGDTEEQAKKHILDSDNLINRELNIIVLLLTKLGEIKVITIYA